ncbi:MAG: hypothetical protein VB137_04725 [Burkholderia sp.]
MLKKVAVQEVAQAARSAAVDAASAAEFKRWSVRAQTRCRPALAARRID